MITNDAIDALQTVFRCFDKIELRYYIGGSLASTAHGKGRMTQDADVVCDLGEGAVSKLFALLDADFYVSQPAVESAVANRSCFNAIHKESFFKVDVFVASDAEYDQQAFDRRQEKAFRIGDEEYFFYVASAEDTILAKLRWFRLGNEVSQNQWSDILGVIAIKRDSLDWGLLERWADNLNVADLLEKARNEAPE